MQVELLRGIGHVLDSVAIVELRRERGRNGRGEIPLARIHDRAVRVTCTNLRDGMAETGKGGDLQGEKQHRLLRAYGEIKGFWGGLRRGTEVRNIKMLILYSPLGGATRAQPCKFRNFWSS